MSDKNYYIMLANPPAEGPSATAIKQPAIYTNRGEVIGEQENEFVFTLDIAGFADPASFPPLDIVSSGQHLLFSKKMIAVLNTCGATNIEYFPAKATYSPTGEDYEYEVANIIGKIPGLNLQESEYQIDDDEDEDDDDPTIYGITKLVFDESRFNHQKIFRLAEKSSLIIVRDDVMRALQNAGATGLLFVQDEGWKPGMI